MSSSDRNFRRKARRRNGFIEIANGFLTLGVLAIVGLAAAVVFAAQQFYAEGPGGAEAAFLVEPSTGLGAVAERLETQGLISNRFVFLFGGKTLKKDRAIKPGQYLVPAHASMRDILTLITEGKPVEFFINVIPGDTAWQVAERLNDPAQNLTGQAVAAPAEGSVLAIRHDFFPGAGRQSLLEAMQASMRTELAAIWAARDPGIEDVIKTPQDLVTLASIVEKETGLAGERPLVAAVFINRLRKGMRLQSDPTIIYGITLGQGKLDRGLKKSEIEAETPYNTYQIDGLPVGPIANPGTDALKAVANPAATKDLYFVARSADPADGHVFSATYAQHRKNVALYRKAMKAQAAAAAEADADAAKEVLEAQQAAKAGDAAE